MCRKQFVIYLTNLDESDIDSTCTCTKAVPNQSENSLKQFDTNPFPSDQFVS